MTAPLLEIEGLVKHFPVRRSEGLFAGRPRVVHAVDGVDLEVMEEEAFGIVGESGSGKSTIGRLIARLTDPTAGRIRLGGEDWLALSGRALRARRRQVQMVFQNPFASLDPRWTVRSIIAEPLVAHRTVPRAGISERVAQLMQAVGLSPELAERYPHQFSGGQRQRIGIARALALEPRLLIADEPVSALDVSVQAQVLNLLRRLQREHRLAVLLISHDLSVVSYLCRRVAVVYLGRIVELGPTRALFAEPLHPYTRALIAAVPEPVVRPRRHAPLPGEPPDPTAPPEGCRFHPRCPYAVARCRTETPALRALRPGHLAACHLAGEIPATAA
jgi:oligopeptide/dipeptide ABC transporter ATP-binding protein